MDLWLSVLPALLTGIIVLAAGILLVREPGQSSARAATEGAIWGGAFFVIFSVETLLIAGN